MLGGTPRRITALPRRWPQVRLAFSKVGRLFGPPIGYAQTTVGADVDTPMSAILGFVRYTPRCGSTRKSTCWSLLTLSRPCSIAFDRARGEAVVSPIDTEFGIAFAVDAHSGRPALRRASISRSRYSGWKCGMRRLIKESDRSGFTRRAASIATRASSNRSCPARATARL